MGADLYGPAPIYTVLYCNVLYSIVLYCTVLYCTVLYYTKLENLVTHRQRNKQKIQKLRLYNIRKFGIHLVYFQSDRRSRNTVVLEDRIICKIYTHVLLCLNHHGNLTTALGSFLESTPDISL